MRRDTTSLIFSFVVLAGVGGASVYRHWADQGQTAKGITRATVLVGVLGLLHGLGGWLMRRQGRAAALAVGPSAPFPGGETLATEPPPSVVHDRAFQDAVGLAALQQAVVLVLAAMLLDGGRALRVAVVAAAAHWAAVLWIRWRRPSPLSPRDAQIIRYGYLPMVLAAALLAWVAGR